jgi:hypothetical protein
MLTFFWISFWLGLTVLAFLAGLGLRGRVRERIGRRAPTVDDDAVRMILKTGTLSTDEDEGLDLNDIAEEERRFWSESWEEPEEW